jgi:hypothetical protein
MDSFRSIQTNLKHLRSKRKTNALTFSKEAIFGRRIKIHKPPGRCSATLRIQLNPGLGGPLPQNAILDAMT